ncbi:MAG: LPS export ABC transporter periplasmic protein LptC [Verrucomicrobiota bacterium]
MNGHFKSITLVIFLLITIADFGVLTDLDSMASEADMELSEFKMRQSNDDGVSWQLNGNAAESRGERVNIHNLDLTIFPQESPPVNITSPYCKYNKTEEDIQSTDKIRVSSKNFILKGEDYFVRLEEQKMHIDNNAVMIIKNTDSFTEKSGDTSDE